MPLRQRPSGLPLCSRHYSTWSHCECLGFRGRARSDDMSELRPWSKVAEPRRDIADGSFDESLFAADLGMVDRGRGPADYLDPVTFCEKTYLTGSLLAFLGELTARLSGDMAAAGVYRLQTEFGGGKTHTLLAAYHLFRDPARVAGTAFVRELAAKLS